MRIQVLWRIRETFLSSLQKDSFYVESRMDSLEKERERKEIQYDIFSGFLAGLSETGELPVDFNERLFHGLVNYATVYSDGRVVFTFRNGAEVSTEI